MKFVIVIPTYNESGNISQLIPLIDKEVKKFKQHDIELLIVDGNSPDGTAGIVRDLSKKYPYVHLLMEKKKAGLGAAYIYGFNHAMKKMKADALVEMDADMQHRPADLTKMIRAFDKGSDYIIGTRYTGGGSIPKEWAFYRKFLSIGGNIFTKLVLGIRGITDFTTGFKISRVKGFVDQIDLKKVNSNVFAYKMDLTVKMVQLGAKVKEVPIKFGLRDRGDSKLERENIMDSLRVVLLIRYEMSKSLIRFAITGFTGFFVDFGLFSLFRQFVVASISSAVSGFLAMLTTYLINNHWSFEDRKHKGAKKNTSSFLVYFAASYVPILFRSWLIDYSILHFGSGFWIVNIAFLIGVVLGMIWNYAVYSRLIWKKK